MPDIMLTHTALTATACAAGVTTDQARAILEAAGVKVEPEMPALPTEPGSAIIATEVRGVTGKWKMFLDPNGYWITSGRIGLYTWHHPGHITKWTEAVVLPVTATPVTLTEEQALALRAEVDPTNRSVPALPRELATKFANAVLAKYAAPAEGDPIDVADMLEGDRVHLVLDNGDEVTITVTRVAPDFLTSKRYVFYTCNIRTVHLLDRKDA